MTTPLPLVARCAYCGRVFELAGGFVTLDKGVRLPLQPMIGQIGIAPAGGVMVTRRPTDTGGNMELPSRLVPRVISEVTPPGSAGKP